MRTILYAQLAPAGLTIARQCEQAQAAGYRIDYVVADEVAAEAMAPLFGRPEGKRLGEALRPGDVLVVNRLDRLGRSYTEISEAIRSFAMHGVTVKTIADDMAFDAGAATPMQQAARDAFIAFASARAQIEAEREAQRTQAERTRNTYDQRDPIFRRETARLQAKISFALIGAMALGVYLIGFVLPISPQNPLPMTHTGEEEIVSNFEPEGQTDRPAEPPQSASQQPDVEQNATQSDAMRSGEARQSEAPKNESDSARAEKQGQVTEGRSTVPPTPSPLAGAAPEPEKPAAAERTIEETPPAAHGVEDKKIRQTVIDWRSARVHRPDFPVRVGNTVPRHVHLATFPRQLVAQVPRYRGYKFIVAENQVAVVDPDTYQIVAVIGE